MLGGQQMSMGESKESLLQRHIVHRKSRVPSPKISAWGSMGPFHVFLINSLLITVPFDVITYSVALCVPPNCFLSLCFVLSCLVSSRLALPRAAYFPQAISQQLLCVLLYQYISL
jgi:hypothetical protein